MLPFSSVWQEGLLRLWIRGVAETGALSSQRKRHTPSSPTKVTQPSGYACRCHGSRAGLSAHSPAPSPTAPAGPGQRRGQVTGTAHSVVCLCRGWHVSDPLALRAEASSSTQDQGPGLFSAEPPRQGRTDRCHASAHLGRTHAPPLNPRCKHSTCTPRTPVFPFRLLQLGNQAGTRAKTKEPGSVIVSQVTSN